MTIRHIAVVVPAGDEEGAIGACLAGIEVARARLHRLRPDVTGDVVVVLDDCHDGTAGIVSSNGGVHAVVTDRRNVGVARGLGSVVALKRAPVSPTQVWTVHTDADSVVPASWLADQLLLAEAGADLVLGTVAPQLTDAERRRWEREYRAHDGHPHVHGANLGIRGDTLLGLGGWPELETGEDASLVDRAVRRGCVVTRVGSLPVATSARRDGRAPFGFSSYLRGLA